jgi:hypothetical protein
MKDIIMYVLLAVLLVSNGFLFMKVTTVSNQTTDLQVRATNLETRAQYWNMAVEILEDCMEYNTLGECKQRYPQYSEQFQ